MRDGPVARASSVCRRNPRSSEVLTFMNNEHRTCRYAYLLATILLGIVPSSTRLDAAGRDKFRPLPGVIQDGARPECGWIDDSDRVQLVFRDTFNSTARIASSENGSKFGMPSIRHDWSGDPRGTHLTDGSWRRWIIDSSRRIVQSERSERGDKFELESGIRYIPRTEDGYDIRSIMPLNPGPGASEQKVRLFLAWTGMEGQGRVTLLRSEDEGWTLVSTGTNVLGEDPDPEQTSLRKDQQSFDFPTAVRIGPDQWKFFATGRPAWERDQVAAFDFDVFGQRRRQEPRPHPETRILSGTISEHGLVLLDSAPCLERDQYSQVSPVWIDHPVAISRNDGTVYLYVSAGLTRGMRKVTQAILGAQGKMIMKHQAQLRNTSFRWRF